MNQGVENIGQKADGAFLWCKKALEKGLKDFSSSNDSYKQSAKNTIEMVLTNLNAMDRGTGEVNPDKKAKQEPIKIPNNVASSRDLTSFVSTTYGSILKDKGIDVALAKNKQFVMDIPNNLSQIIAAKGKTR